MCLGVFNKRALSGDSNYNFVPKSITTGITDESWLAKIKQSKSKNQFYGFDDVEKELRGRVPLNIFLKVLIFKLLKPILKICIKFNILKWKSKKKF